MNNQPTKEQIDDFNAWFENLDEDDQTEIEIIPAIVWEILPKFVNSWPVFALCSIIKAQ